MAGAILGGVISTLSSPVLEQFGLAWGVEEELGKLSSTLSTVQAVLEDAERKEPKEKAIRDWLKKLKDAAYEAVDIVEECASEGLQAQEANIDQSCTDVVCSSFLSCFSFERIIFRREMGRRISQITARLEKIEKERNFHLREGVADRGFEIGQRETSSIPPETEIYGRDEDKENIVQLLLNNHDELSICPILGMGGLGKTTLAQLAYNDERVKNHFDIKAWVCVSESFDIERILTEIRKSIGGPECKAFEPIQRILQNKLKGKRFLIVLDDVWNQNEEQWDKMKRGLTCGAHGSSIVVTTRMKGVATIMGTRPAYHLTHLSEGDCWNLFKQRAFDLRNEENPVLVKIGKEIVKKCGGVPLAAKALGSLVCGKSNEREWLIVRDSELWELGDKENEILPALRLSYSHLPSQLKQCFSYCSIFPKDYELEKEELIHLWMANGFIQSSGRKEMEDIGNEIFNDLLWMSFFQNIEKDEDDNIIKCKMHDLVHDLACSVMVDECSRMEAEKLKNIPARIRHLSLTFGLESPSNPLESLQKYQHIRTLLSKRPSDKFIKDLHLVFSNLRCLRALDLSGGYQLTILPVSIGELKLLRYLNLSNTKITTLPESIISLRNLQTLKLNSCYYLEKLPKDMRKMSSLRHLEFSDCIKLTEMPIGMGQLMCLQTLSNFIVGQNSGGHVKELQELNHLKGELHIEGLENVRNSVEAKEANLIGKKNLFSLQLYWRRRDLRRGDWRRRYYWSEDDDGEACLQEDFEEVLEGLQPPQNIRVFGIEGYVGVEFPNWMGDLALPNLVRVTIRNCRRCEHLPPLGQLRHLKDLTIERLNCVKYIGKGFPSLVELYIYNMLNLEDWLEEEAGELLPCLSKLVVRSCPKLRSLPLLPSLNHLEIWSCNEEIIRSLGNLTRLSSLHIIKFREMKCFPEGVLQNLTALKDLEIWSCSNLISLPEGLQNLTAIQDLNISNCPHLEKQYRREGGKEWDKISHIPLVYIDGALQEGN